MIRTIAFDPLVVLIDDVQTEVFQSSYKDEDGINQTVFYVIDNGKKIPIHHRADLFVAPSEKIDDALERVETKRLEKIELEKNNPEVKP